MSSPEGLGDKVEPVVEGESDLMEIIAQPDIVPGPEPVEPTRKRRILTDNLEGLDPRVSHIAKKAARECVTEIGRFKASKPEVQSQRLASKKDEGSRVFYSKVAKQLDKSKDRREKFGKARKTKVSSKVEDPRKVGFGSVKDAIDEHITGGEKVARPYGQQKGGALRERGHVLALNPVIKIGSQTEQLLGRVSQLFMRAASDMEYETMLVNQRWFVSANNTANVEKVSALFLQDMLTEAAKGIVDDNADSPELRAYSIGALASALGTIDPGAALSKQQQRGAELLSELSVGHHVDADVRKELRDALKILQAQVRSRMKVHGPLSPDEAAAALKDDKLKNHVIAVLPPDDDSHAEQYLALTLVKAGYTGRAVISGTKNPCSCCWLTLTLVLQHDYDLKFNNTAGLYWPKSARGVKLVAEALGVTDISYLMEYFQKANKLTNDEDRFLQHLTALREVDLIVDIPKSGGGLKDKGLTQDQSARSVYMVDNPSFSKDKLPDDFVAYPGSPVYSYNSPRREDDSEVERDEMLIDRFPKQREDWEAQSKKADEQRKKKEAARKKLAEQEAAKKKSGEPPQ